MLKMEIKRMMNRPFFWFIILVGLLLGILPVVQSWPSGVIKQDFAFYPMSPYVSWMPFGTAFSIYDIYCMIVPLISSIAYADTYAEDHKTGMIKSILTKVQKQNYILTRFSVNFIIGGLVVILPLVINLLACMTAFPLIHNNFYFGMDMVGTQDFWPSLYYHNPLIYILIRILIVFFMGAMLASLGLALSTFVKNRYVVVLFPFLLFMGTDAVFVSFGSQYSIIDVFLYYTNSYVCLITYLSVGMVSSFIWFYAAGVKNETI